ncbi:hypothetical protein SUGI_0624070 [Cryptomeria japonica]|nr:hypothetical protein SUGI_0624070 [Cryptomeria japonica]
MVTQLNDLPNKDFILLDNTIWKITYSNKFTKLFTSLKDLYVQKQVINTLWRWVNDRQQARKLAGPAEQSLINEYVILELHLADIEQGVQVSLVLKMWNLLTLKELHGLRQGLENVFSTYALGNIEQCKVKCLGSDGRRVLPMQWKDDPELVWYKCIQKSEMLETIHLEAYEQKTISLELARVKEKLLLMEFYSLLCGITNQLLTATEGSDIGFQFNKNKENHARMVEIKRVMENLLREEDLVCNHEGGTCNFQLHASFGPAFVEEQPPSEDDEMKAQTMIKGEKIVYTPHGPSRDDSGSIGEEIIPDSEWKRSPCLLTSKRMEARIELEACDFQLDTSFGAAIDEEPSTEK